MRRNESLFPPPLAGPQKPPAPLTLPLPRSGGEAPFAWIGSPGRIALPGAYAPGVDPRNHLPIESPEWVADLADRAINWHKYAPFARPEPKLPPPTPRQMRIENPWSPPLIAPPLHLPLGLSPRPDAFR